MGKHEVNLKDVESGQGAPKPRMSYGQGPGCTKWLRGQNTVICEHVQALGGQQWFVAFHSNVTSHNYTGSCLKAQTIHVHFMSVNSLHVHKSWEVQALFLIYRLFRLWDIK